MHILLFTPFLLVAQPPDHALTGGLSDTIKIQALPGTSTLPAFSASGFNNLATNPDRAKPSQGRRWLVGGASLAAYGGSFVFLNAAWYRDYQRSGFHTFDDSGEWQQVDKVGHAWSAAVSASLTTRAWQWAGVPRRQSVWLGAGTSLAYLLSIEYLDGRSEQWGWSWADVAADVFGTGLFAAQELGWKEQRISLKYSAHTKSYDPSVRSRANNLYGTSLPERLLKDYNAQTYWLSFNMASLAGSEALPPWLNVAIGYGAEGMFGGYENLARDKDGNIVFDRRDIKRYRQWYLAPDLDLTRIPTKKKWLKTAFFVLNHIKFPAPALELSGGKLRLRGVGF